MADEQSPDDLLREEKIHDEGFASSKVKIRKNSSLVHRIICCEPSNEFIDYKDYDQVYTKTEVPLSSTVLSGLGNGVRVYKICNPFLYAAFLLKKKQKCYTGETTVFHGTRIENIDSICQTNFNYRLIGKYGHLGNKYGDGVSFSKDLEYAKMFPRRVFGRKAMFLVKVIRTMTCIGSLGLEIPPNGYDTSISSNRKVLVKYCDNEFYPTHVAYY